MVTIKTYENIIAAQKRIRRETGFLVRDFQRMENVSANCFNTSTIQRTYGTLQKTQNSWNGIRQAVIQTSGSQENLNNKIATSNIMVNNLQKRMLGLRNSLSKIIAAEKLISSTDSVANGRTRLNSVLLTYDDGGSIAEIERRVMASSQRSRTAYFDTVDSVSKLALNAKGIFNTFDEVIDFQELLNKQFAIGGAGLQQQRAGMTQLIDAMSAGFLSAQDIAMLWEVAPGMIQNIADYMNIPVEQMKGLAAEGFVTADIVKNAMFGVTSEVNSEFEKLPMTWRQIWILCGNVVAKALQPLLTAVGWLVKNLDMIAPIVLGMTAAFIAYNGVAAITNSLIATQAFMKKVDAAASMRASKVMFTQIAAQQGLNAALYTCPLVWMIGLVILLIASFYAVIGVINHLTDSSISATGVIAGAFASLGTFMLNTFIVPVVKAIAAFANFLTNVFQNPLGAVSVLVLDFVLLVLGYIKKLAEGIEGLVNLIPGVNVDITSKIDGWYDDTVIKKEAWKNTSGWQEYYQGIDYIDYQKAARGGYDYGKSLGDGMKEKFGFGNGSMAGIYGGGAYGAYGIYENNNGQEMYLDDETIRAISDSVAGKKSAVSEAPVFHVNIEQTVNARVDSKMDFQAIANYLVNDFNEQMVSSMEGMWK